MRRYPFIGTYIILAANLLVYLLVNASPKLASYSVIFKSESVIEHRTTIKDGVTLYTVPTPSGTETLTYGPGNFLFVQAFLSIFLNVGLFNLIIAQLVGFSILRVSELVLGTVNLLFMYVLIGIVSSLLTAYFDPSPFAQSGSFATLAGVLIVFAFLMPDLEFLFILLPIPIKAKYSIFIQLALFGGLFYWSRIEQDSFSLSTAFHSLMGIVAGFAVYPLVKYAIRIRQEALENGGDDDSEQGY